MRKKEWKREKIGQEKGRKEERGVKTKEETAKQ